MIQNRPAMPNSRAQSKSSPKRSPTLSSPALMKSKRPCTQMATMSLQPLTVVDRATFRESYTGKIPEISCELPTDDDPDALVFSYRIQDYMKWIPLAQDSEDGEARFRKRYIDEVVNNKYGPLPGSAMRSVPKHIEQELKREWNRTKLAYDMDAPRRKADATRIFRLPASVCSISTASHSFRLRAHSVGQLVIELDTPLDPNSINLASEKEARDIITRERGDEIEIERKRLAKMPKPANTARDEGSEIGPHGETTETHDIVYVSEKSGAGRGQRITMRTWVPKRRDADDDDVYSRTDYGD
jgi:hypothetical protein